MTFDLLQEGRTVGIFQLETRVGGRRGGKGLAVVPWVDVDGDECDEIRKCMLGWDITDFGSGDFYDVGLVVFTVRNGHRELEPYTRKTYCEKNLFYATLMKLAFDSIKTSGHDAKVAVLLNDWRLASGAGGELWVYDVASAEGRLLPAGGRPLGFSPGGALVVGVPGRVISVNGERCTQMHDLHHERLPDPVAEALTQLSDRIEELETRLQRIEGDGHLSVESLERTVILGGRK